MRTFQKHAADKALTTSSRANMPTKPQIEPLPDEVVTKSFTGESVKELISFSLSPSITFPPHSEIKVISFKYAIANFQSLIVIDI